MLVFFTEATTLPSRVVSPLKRRRHKDSENPQLVKVGKGKPVISFSIGLSCDFGYKCKCTSET